MKPGLYENLAFNADVINSMNGGYNNGALQLMAGIDCLLKPDFHLF
jgi:hypothetical protein